MSPAQDPLKPGQRSAGSKAQFTRPPPDPEFVTPSPTTQAATTKPPFDPWIITPSPVTPSSTPLIPLRDPEEDRITSSLAIAHELAHDLELAQQDPTTTAERIGELASRACMGIKILTFQGEANIAIERLKIHLDREGKTLDRSMMYETALY
jgi:hypothetical protein